MLSPVRHLSESSLVAPLRSRFYCDTIVSEREGDIPVSIALPHIGGSQAYPRWLG